jgi:hypothetical protein
MSPNKEATKHGVIFVNFMTACMAGSSLAGGEWWASSCCALHVAGSRIPWSLWRLLETLAHVDFAVGLCVRRCERYG